MRPPQWSLRTHIVASLASCQPAERLRPWGVQASALREGDASQTHSAADRGKQQTESGGWQVRAVCCSVVLILMCFVWFFPPPPALTQLFLFPFVLPCRTSNLTTSLQNQIQSLRDGLNKAMEQESKLKKELESKNEELQEKSRTITQVKKIGRRYKTQYDELKVNHDKVGVIWPFSSCSVKELRVDWFRLVAMLWYTLFIFHLIGLISWLLRQRQVHHKTRRLAKLQPRSCRVSENHWVRPRQRPESSKDSSKMSTRLHSVPNPENKYQICPIYWMTWMVNDQRSLSFQQACNHQCFCPPATGCNRARERRSQRSGAVVASSNRADQTEAGAAREEHPGGNAAAAANWEGREGQEGLSPGQAEDQPAYGWALHCSVVQIVSTPHAGVPIC